MEKEAFAKIGELTMEKDFLAGALGHIWRLIRKMGLEAIYCKPRTSIPKPGNHIYPYLLKDLQIERPNQVWTTDITYLPMNKGFAYLVAIIDLYNRRVMSWRLSNTMDASFYIKALEDAIQRFDPPEIFKPGICNDSCRIFYVFFSLPFSKSSSYL